MLPVHAGASRGIMKDEVGAYNKASFSVIRTLGFYQSMNSKRLFLMLLRPGSPICHNKEQLLYRVCLFCHGVQMRQKMALPAPEWQRSTKVTMWVMASVFSVMFFHPSHTTLKYLQTCHNPHYMISLERSAKPRNGFHSIARFSSPYISFSHNTIVLSS